MKRAVLITLGVLFLVLAAPLLIGGSFLTAWASGEEDPTVEGRIGQVESAGYAVVSDRVEFDGPGPFPDRWEVTLAVADRDSDAPVFIGYGPAQAVDSYLAGSPYTVVRSLGTGDDRPRNDAIDILGTGSPQPPGEQDFWVAQASGSGRQQIALAPDQGDFRFVAMNADASPGVSLVVYGSMQVPFLLPVGIALLVTGGLLAILGVVLLVLGIRAASGSPAAGYGPPGYGPPGYGPPGYGPQRYPGDAGPGATDRPPPGPH
jgi:hypothetical protein